MLVIYYVFLNYGILTQIEKSSWKKLKKFAWIFYKVAKIKPLSKQIVQKDPQILPSTIQPYNSIFEFRCPAEM